MINESGNDTVCGSAVCQKTADGVVLITATPSVVKLVCGEGKGLEDLRKENIFNGIHPEDLEQVKHVLNDAFDKGKSSECNFRRIDTATDRYVWFYGSCMPLKQENGHVYVFCTFVDISRHKEMEEELAESRRLGNETAMNLSKLYNEEIMRLSTFYDGYTCIIRYNLNIKLCRVHER